MRKSSFLLLPAALFLSCLLLASAHVSADTDIRLEGLDSQSGLRSWLQETVLEKYANKEEALPHPYAGIKIDAEKALNAKGYYAPTIVFNESDTPTLHIDAGPVYTIGHLSVHGADGYAIEDVSAGDILDAAEVLRAQNDLKKVVMRDHCHYTLRVRNEVRLDHRARTGDVRLVVEAGPEARFGQTAFEGAPSIKRHYLENFIKYRQGACWDGNKIEETKAALMGTGLLSVVREDLPEEPMADGTVPVRFALTERAPRTIRLGASYYTDEGPGILAEWQHRNILGAGESLSAHLKASFLDQFLRSEFRKPFFMRDDQTLRFSAEVGRTDSDAYEEWRINSAAYIDRKFTRHLTGSLGTAVEWLRLTEKESNRNVTNDYGLISVPARLDFDNRDDPLDPHEGWSWNIATEPYFDALGEASPFFKTSVAARTYVALADDPDLVLALRARLGSITGGGTGDIPASKRFYAGGGGSIRGFGYQEAGPMENGDPAGGRSLVETSAELRFKMTETIGGVAFVDSGGAYDSSYPDFKEGYYVGAGVGARYYTSFGPLRFDIAVPVNKRDQTDQKFQIYISIGQAF